MLRSNRSAALPANTAAVVGAVACMVVTVGQTSSANAQASAQPALDLRVHHAPVRLKMRRAQPKLLAVGVQPRTVASAQAAEASPASTVATDAIP
nr:hypothetical protein [Kofleriaceae bacterium]